MPVTRTHSKKVLSVAAVLEVETCILESTRFQLSRFDRRREELGCVHGRYAAVALLISRSFPTEGAISPTRQVIRIAVMQVSQRHLAWRFAYPPPTQYVRRDQDFATPVRWQLPGEETIQGPKRWRAAPRDLSRQALPKWVEPRYDGAFSRLIQADCARFPVSKT